MSVFRFPLEKVLEWRRTQLEIEESKFQRLAAQRDALDRERAELQASDTRAETDVLRWQPLHGEDLAALADFRLRLRAREKEVAERRQQCARQLEAQRTAMIEAQRRCRLLERLKERRGAEWRAACERELELMAAESYLARWNSGSNGRSNGDSNGR